MFCLNSPAKIHFLPNAAKDFQNMAKKIFVRARVVKSKRWSLDYSVFVPETGETKRFRREFNLNSIENLVVRAHVAEILCDFLEDFFAVQPIAKPASVERPLLSVDDGVAKALEEKMKLPRKNSHRSYKSVSNTFLKWCRAEKLDKLPAEQFTRRHARDFWDYLTSRRKYRGVTLGNYKTHLSGLWAEMESREMVKENPWRAIKVRVLEEKIRRPFTDAEKHIVAMEAEKTDYWLFRAILLQYYCFIRPVEITRLKFKDFDLARGVVVISSGNAKKWKRRTATIPASVLHYFRDGRFDRYPANHYVLGKFDLGRENFTLEPCTTPIGDDRMYKRHQKLLANLKAAGKLTNIEGLSYYSWKDTGISRHVRATSPAATKDQAGHTSFAVTSRYYHAEEFNAEYAGILNDLT